MLFHRKKNAKKPAQTGPSAISGGNSNQVLKGHKKRKKVLHYGSGQQASIDQTNLGKLKHHVSIGARVSKWLHLDPLHRMERRIVSYTLAFSLLIIALTVCGVNDHMFHVRQSEVLTNYGSKAQFSKTGSPTMTLHHLQMTKDRKTVFVPISFNDMSQLSENAKKYGVFISAARGSISYQPKGRFALFGDTGRGAIIMHDRHGFANEPINVFILNYTNLNNSGAQESQSDTNFDGNDIGIKTVMKDFDALHFKINPGAKEEKLNGNLHQTQPYSDVYKQLFAEGDLQYINRKNAKYRHKIKINKNVSQDEIFRLKQAGFNLKTSKVKVPAWLKHSWKPYDAIEPNGVPKNDENKKNIESVASDGANSPLLNKTDTQDEGHYPANLKKKDGTTTASAGNSDNEGTGKSSTLNGGSNADPSSMWEDLKQAWNNILQYKHEIFTTDAAMRYKINATCKSQNKTTSIGHHFKVLKHLV